MCYYKGGPSLSTGQHHLTTMQALQLAREQNLSDLCIEDWQTGLLEMLRKVGLNLCSSNVLNLQSMQLHIRQMRNHVNSAETMFGVRIMWVS